jgi:hypothetical protein
VAHHPIEHEIGPRHFEFFHGAELLAFEFTLLEVLGGFALTVILGIEADPVRGLETVVDLAAFGASFVLPAPLIKLPVLFARPQQSAWAGDELGLRDGIHGFGSAF